MADRLAILFAPRQGFGHAAVAGDRLAGGGALRQDFLIGAQCAGQIAQLDQNIALQIDQGGVGDEILARQALQSVSNELRCRDEGFFTLGFDELDHLGPVRHLGSMMNRLLPVAHCRIAFSEGAVELLFNFTAVDGEQLVV